MATQTQTLQRNAVQPYRVHDYLYDPNYVVSGERDHVRSSVVAQASNSRIKRLPVFETMFTDLRHHPRIEFRVDGTDPVPRFISRQWRGNQVGQQDNATTRFVSFSSARSHGDPQVSGTNRYKYFRRPQIPFSQSLGQGVILSSSRQDALSAPAASARHGADTPVQKTIQTQTDYRDSEAQTDPYSPDYMVKPGTQPELLTLALLSYGCGLPAGLAEVEMIERARAKRAWEATLPPLNDMSQLEKRRKMMEEQERNEWALREREIEKLQEERLRVLIKLLQEREDKSEEMMTKRLDRLWTRKEMERKEQVRKIRNEFMRAVRKLTAKKEKVEGKLERRNIVKDYSNFGSQAFAPLTRVGVFIDRLADQYVVKNKYLTTYEGLLELENSLPSYMLQPTIRAPRRQTTTSAGFIKRKYRQELELGDIHKALKEKEEKLLAPVKPLRFLQKVERPVPRPPTPSVAIPDEREEERELATVFLQQVLRGRSVQSMMHEGKEKRIELISELRSTHALQAAGQQAMKEQKNATLQLQKQRQLVEQKENVMDEAMGVAEGESLADTLDFLNKELIRLQEERRIHAFSMLAERHRRIREAEESGLRQVEERRRREEDEIFKQVVKVHQDTIDTYLEDILLVTLERKADEQARAEIQLTAQKINEAAYEMEARRTEMESEEIVAELVYGFLLPEAQKQYLKEKVADQQRKYLSAAHNEIRELLSESCKEIHLQADNHPGGESHSQSGPEEKRETSSTDSGKKTKQASSQNSADPRKTPTEGTRVPGRHEPDTPGPRSRPNSRLSQSSATKHASESKDAASGSQAKPSSGRSSVAGRAASSGDNGREIRSGGTSSRAGSRTSKK